MRDFETDKHYEEMEPDEGIEFLSKLFSEFISPETGKFTEEISYEEEIKDDEDFYPDADNEEIYEKALKVNFPDDKYVINPWEKETLSEESLRVKKNIQNSF